MESKTIKVSIQSNGEICFIPLPFDPKEVFGKVRVPVKVTLNGYTFQTTIAKMGGQAFVPLRKSNKEASGVEAGDLVRVEITADKDPRKVEIPTDLAEAINAKPDLWEQWGKLSYTVQRESVEGVIGAKKPETRERRIRKIVDEILQKDRAEMGKHSPA